MKIKTDCIFCGAENTEKNISVLGESNKHALVLKCWQCSKYFSYFNGKSSRLPGWFYSL